MELLERGPVSYTSTLTAAKTFARSGKVNRLDVVPGHAVCQMSAGPTGQLAVRLSLPPIGPEAWQRIANQLAAKAQYAARLLAGELPDDLAELVSGQGETLLPGCFEDVHIELAVPHAAPEEVAAIPRCKYAVVAWMLLVEHVDTDPLSLIEFRGLPRELLLQTVSHQSGGGAPASSAGSSPAPANADASEDVLMRGPASLAEPPLDPERFWGFSVSVSPAGLPARPPVSLAVLKRLGLPDFAPAPRALWHGLARAYPSHARAESEQD